MRVSEPWGGGCASRHGKPARGAAATWTDILALAPPQDGRCPNAPSRAHSPAVTPPPPPSLRQSKRLARIDAEMKKKAAAGKLPAEVDDLLHKDIKTGIDLS